MHGTVEASNDGRIRVRIIHGLTLVIKNSYTYCKSLLALEAKYYYACSQEKGWQELTIARSRPPHIRKAIKEHPMLQICYTTFTIRACYGTWKPQHKYFSISQLLNQHNSNITIFMSQIIIKYQTSHSIHCTFYDSFYFTHLGGLSYQDQLYNQSKLPCCSKRL